VLPNTYFLGTPPTVAARQTAHKHCHGLIGTARLQRVVRSLRAFAAPAAELPAFVGINAVGFQDLGAGDLVQIATARQHRGLGGLLALAAHLCGGQLGGAEVHDLVGGQAALDDVRAQALVEIHRRQKRKKRKRRRRRLCK